MNNIIDIKISEDSPYKELEMFVRNSEGDTFFCDVCHKVTIKFLGILHNDCPRIDICEDCLKNILEKFKDLDRW